MFFFNFFLVLIGFQSLLFNLPSKYSLCFYENAHCLLTYLLMLCYSIFCAIIIFLIFAFLMYIFSKNYHYISIKSSWTGSCIRMFKFWMFFQRLTPCPLSEFLYDSVPSLPKSCSIKRLGLIVGHQSVGITVWSLTVTVPHLDSHWLTKGCS